MKKTERLLLELLFNKKLEAPPTKRPTRNANAFTKVRDKDITVRHLIKVLKKTPELRKELEDALKALQPEKKNESKLSLGQKYMMWTLAAVTLPPLYVALIHALFTAIRP